MSDPLRPIFVHIVVILVLVGGFYALVLYPFVLDDLVKGAIIGYMGAAIQFEFGSEIAKTTANATTKALHTPTTPVDEGPSYSRTVSEKVTTE